LSQPVRLSDKAFKPTHEVQFADLKWPLKHLQTLRSNYGRAPCFSEIFPEFEAILVSGDENLASLNLTLIKWIARRLEINCRFVMASELKSERSKSERLIELIQYVGGKSYLAGSGGLEYLDRELFATAEIDIVPA